MQNPCNMKNNFKNINLSNFLIVENFYNYEHIYKFVCKSVNMNVKLNGSECLLHLLHVQFLAV